MLPSASIDFVATTIFIWWWRRRRLIWWREEDLPRRRKSDPLKLRWAAQLRRETPLTLKWIAARLKMGTWKHLNRRLQEHAKPRK